MQKQRLRGVNDQVALTSSPAAVAELVYAADECPVPGRGWCGDCINQCPIFEHFAAAAPGRSRSVTSTATNMPTCSAALQINGGNRVPVLVFFSEDGLEVARYGERTLSKYRQMMRDQAGPTLPDRHRRFRRSAAGPGDAGLAERVRARAVAAAVVAAAAAAARRLRIAKKRGSSQEFVGHCKEPVAGKRFEGEKKVHPGWRRGMDGLSQQATAPGASGCVCLLSCIGCIGTRVLFTESRNSLRREVGQRCGCRCGHGRGAGPFVRVVGSVGLVMTARRSGCSSSCLCGAWRCSWPTECGVSIARVAA